MPEVVSLGEFLSAAGLQEMAPAPDPRYAAAVARGLEFRPKLMKAEGGSLAAEEPGLLAFGVPKCEPPNQSPKKQISRPTSWAAHMAI
jgi:hypothetical protein